MSKTLKKICTIDGKEASGFDLLMLWQSITQGKKRLAYAKNGSHFVNFITQLNNK